MIVYEWENKNSHPITFSSLGHHRSHRHRSHSKSPERYGLNLYCKNLILGWEGGSLGKVLLMQAWEFSNSTHNICIKSARNLSAGEAERHIEFASQPVYPISQLQVQWDSVSQNKVENELGRHSMFTSGFHMCTCTHLNLYSIVKVVNITEMGSFEMGIGSSLQDKIGSPPPPPISFALCFPSWN